MASDKKLREYIDNQEKILDDLRDVLKDLDKDKERKSREGLESEISDFKTRIETCQSRITQLEEENIKQKMALLDLASAEKMKILTLSRNSREIYFKDKTKKTMASLSAFEDGINKKIHVYQKKLLKDLGQRQQELQKETESHFEEIRKILKKNRDELEEKEESFLQDVRADYRFLEKEPVSQEQIDRRAKRNRLEMKIGMQILNKLGIALVLISIGFLAYYSKNSYLQAALIFLLGGAFLALGEFFYRKGKQPFALTLTGGAVGVLYSGVFFSHFVLKSGFGSALLSQNIALLMVVCITLFTLFLSWIRKSEIIQIIGLVGGFLPFLSFLITTGFNGTFVYLGMGYLFLINLAVLALAFFKKWRLSGIISFILHTPALIYLVFRSASKEISLIYILLVYLVYLSVVLVPRLFLNRTLKIWDVLMLGANSLVMGILSFTLFSQMGWRTFWSIPALLFAVFYFLLARKVQARGKNRNGEFFLFMGMSLLFSLWTIPVLFGLKGLITGFLLEALILITLGHKKSFPYLEKAGWVAYFGLVVLLVFRLFLSIWKSVGSGPEYIQPLFNWVSQGKNWFIHDNLILFAAGSLGLLIVYAPWLKQHLADTSPRSRRLILFRNLTLVFLYITILFESIVLMLNLADRFPLIDLVLFGYDYDLIGYAVFVCLSLFSCLFALVLSFMKKWHDHTVIVFRNIAFFAGFLFFLISIPVIGNRMDSEVLRETMHFSVKAVILVLEILYSVALLFSLWRIISSSLVRKKGSLGAFPLVYGIILLCFLSYFLFFRILFPPAAVFGFSYLSVSIAFIFWGFRKYYPPLRILGLITLFIALFVLLFPLVRQASIPVIIISFLVYGLLMLGISFFYHHISQKRMNHED